MARQHPSLRMFSPRACGLALNFSSFQNLHMAISDLIDSMARPFSALRRDVIIGGALIQTRQLSFNMQPQLQSDWCWAATSTSVSLYYWTGSPWTQCKVAGAELSQNTCCQAPVPEPCNVAWSLQKALTRTNNFVSISSPIGFDQVKVEIDSGRPLGARIGWHDGGGHFVAIYGYIEAGNAQYFNIDDPIYGKSHPSVSEFTNNYQQSGSWTDAYITKSYIGNMFINPVSIDEDIVQKVMAARPVLSAGEGADELHPLQGRSLGLAHPVYTIGLHSLVSDEKTPRETGLRVLEMEGQTPRAFFDLADGRVNLMSASAPYLDLFTNALQVVDAIQSGSQRFSLRLLRVPALNFEAIWLHADEGGQDQVIPLRPFHGFVPMQPVPYVDAIAKLSESARREAQQDNTMGA